MQIRAVHGALAFLTLVLATATASVASAADDTLEDLLIEKGFITEEELATAREEAAASGAAATEAEPAKAPEKEKEQEPQVKVSAGSKGLIVESPDGDFVFAFGGRLQWDFGGFHGGLTPLGDGTQLRRARIKSYGTVWRTWDYKLEVNFDTNGEVSVTDGWIRYSGWKPFTVTAGHQKVPFSLQSMTSSNFQVFQERALPDAFIDNDEEGRRRVGVVLQSYGDFWNVAGGVFGEGVATPGGGVNEDWGTAGRAVLFPIAEAKRLISIGGSVYYRQFESSSALQYRNRPEAHLADFRLVDTGKIANADDDLMYNIESAVVFGPVHAQGEYFGVRVDRIFASSLKFSGWYAQAGFFLTGESRNFDVKSAQFKGIKPSRKIGAWEIAARWSDIDLQTKDILGGEEHNLTVGLNWWVNQNVMFRFNYVRAWVEPNSTKLIPSPTPANWPIIFAGVNETTNAFMGRMQIVF